jgi:hypothetical protein
MIYNSNIQTSNPSIISIDENAQLDPFHLYDNDIAPIVSIDPSIFKTPEYVRGEMITAQITANHIELISKNFEDSFELHMKKDLAYKIAQEIIKNKLVEFTKQRDPNTDTIVYRARAYLTPDDKVRKIRLSNK